jgi:uncharacterized SAM-binding protein YcdF (DUF218 family)
VIIDFVKQFLYLGSPLSLVVVLAAGLLLCARPSSRLFRACFFTALIGFWLVTTSIGSTLLTAPLVRGLTPLQSRTQANGADTVVLLGGGASTFSTGGRVVGVLTPTSAMRVLEAARVTDLIGARLVVASAGIPRPDLQLRPESEMLRDALVAAGVSPDKIVQESESKTTREQAELVPAILRAHGVRQFVLVTSPTHMRRALALFRAVGLDPVPSIAQVRSEQLGPPSFVVPSDDALRQSGQAIYEFAAWVYYWWNGWFKARPGAIAREAAAPIVSAGPVNSGPPAATYPWLAPSTEALTQNAYRLPRLK